MEDTRTQTPRHQARTPLVTVRPCGHKEPVSDQMLARGTGAKWISTMCDDCGATAEYRIDQHSGAVVDWRLPSIQVLE